MLFGSDDGLGVFRITWLERTNRRRGGFADKGRGYGNVNRVHNDVMPWVYVWRAKKGWLSVQQPGAVDCTTRASVWHDSSDGGRSGGTFSLDAV